MSAVWARCGLWELTPSVCERARQVAPGKSLRTLDALHLATFILAREKLEGLELVTVDDRLQAALEAVQTEIPSPTPKARTRLTLRDFEATKIEYR